MGPEWHKIDWQAIEQVEKERVRRRYEESQPRMLGKDIDDPVTRTKGNDAGNVTDLDAMQQEKTQKLQKDTGATAQSVEEVVKGARETVAGNETDNVLQ